MGLCYDDYIYDDLKESKAQVEKLSKFIVMNGDRLLGGDWACAQCYPHSDMLVDGFECGFHLAKRLCKQDSEAEK